MDVASLINKLQALDPSAQVEIMIKPLTGQMGLVIKREPWDDNIVIMETD